MRGWSSEPSGRSPVGVRRSYSGHSLRAGLATAAAEAELHDVMRQTRHKSVEVARRYMRSAAGWSTGMPGTPMIPCSSACAPAA